MKKSTLPEMSNCTPAYTIARPLELPRINFVFIGLPDDPTFKCLSTLGPNNLVRSAPQYQYHYWASEADYFRKVLPKEVCVHDINELFDDPHINPELKAYIPEVRELLAPLQSRNQPKDRAIASELVRYFLLAASSSDGGDYVIDTNLISKEGFSPRFPTPEKFTAVQYCDEPSADFPQQPQEIDIWLLGTPPSSKSSTALSIFKKYLINTHELMRIFKQSPYSKTFYKFAASNTLRAVLDMGLYDESPHMSADKITFLHAVMGFCSAEIPKLNVEKYFFNSHNQMILSESQKGPQAFTFVDNGPSNLLKILLNQGSDPTDKYMGISLLLYAMYRNKNEHVKVILEYMSSIEQLNKTMAPIPKNNRYHQLFDCKVLCSQNEELAYLIKTKMRSLEENPPDNGVCPPLPG